MVKAHSSETRQSGFNPNSGINQLSDPGQNAMDESQMKPQIQGIYILSLDQTPKGKITGSKAIKVNTSNVLQRGYLAVD